MNLYKIIYNEHLELESIRIIKDNGSNINNPITIVPLQKDATTDDIRSTIQKLKDKQHFQE